MTFNPEEKAKELVRFVEAVSWSDNWTTHKAIPTVTQALREAYEAGVMESIENRRGVSVHGSDGCMNCETGRITIYAGSRWCSKCQNKKERRG